MECRTFPAIDSAGSHLSYITQRETFSLINNMGFPERPLCVHVLFDERKVAITIPLIKNLEMERMLSAHCGGGH